MSDAARHRSQVEPTDDWTGKPSAVARPVLFGTAIRLPQPRLFRLESLGEDGWLKTVRLNDYAPRRSKPGPLQQALFPYHEAWG